MCRGLFACAELPTGRRDLTAFDSGPARRADLMGSRFGELGNIEDFRHDRPERLSAAVVGIEQLLNRRTNHCPKRSLFGTHVDQGDEGIDDFTLKMVTNTACRSR